MTPTEEVTPPSKETPHPKAATPHPKTATPHPKAATPHPKTATPHPKAVTPHPKTATPHPRAVTPHPESTTPHREPVTRHPESMTPPQTTRTAPTTLQRHVQTIQDTNFGKLPMVAARLREMTAFAGKLRQGYRRTSYSRISAITAMKSGCRRGFRGGRCVLEYVMRWPPLLEVFAFHWPPGLS